MEVAAVGSSLQASDQDLAQLVQEVNRVQIEMMKKMLQAQAEMIVAAQKVRQGEDVQGAVDYYA